MNFMFLKDTGWCQNPLLIHFRRDTSSSKDLTPDQESKSVSSVQGRSIYSLAHLFQLSGRFPVSASPSKCTQRCNHPAHHLQAGSSLALVGNVGNWLGQISAASHADPANASLWICARKLIGQTPAAGLQQEPSALVPHFCGQEAAGCNVLGECIVRHCCLHPQLPAVAPSPSHGELRSRSSPCSTAQARLPCGEMWLDLGSKLPRAGKLHAGTSDTIRASTPLTHRDAISAACWTH